MNLKNGLKEIFDAAQNYWDVKRTGLIDIFNGVRDINTPQLALNTLMMTIVYSFLYNRPQEYLIFGLFTGVAISAVINKNRSSKHVLQGRISRELSPLYELSSLCHGVDLIEAERQDLRANTKLFNEEIRQEYRNKLKLFDEKYGGLSLPERADLYELTHK